ncbi:MAG: hypothetical protein AAGC95_14815 [Pseudomonadota bacterium]
MPLMSFRKYLCVWTSVLAAPHLVFAILFGAASAHLGEVENPHGLDDEACLQTCLLAELMPFRLTTRINIPAPHMSQDLIIRPDGDDIKVRIDPPAVDVR